MNFFLLFVLTSSSMVSSFVILWILFWKCYLNHFASIKGPVPIPILGNVHLLGKYENPFEAFTALSKKYGQIYSLYLGSVPCVVVNNFSMIKDVLIRKGSKFGGRPNYIRYHKLFGGDRNNSLALCDWSDLQKTRRHIARSYCSPRFTSFNYQLLSTVSTAELKIFLGELQPLFGSANDAAVVDLKPLVLRACANMFSEYMCSTRFSYDNRKFRHIVRNYDEIFWDINQGYALDFFPCLAPLYRGYMRKLFDWAGEIRAFIGENIVEHHLKTIDYEEAPRNFTDALLINLKEDENLQWDHVMYELEDFLGGHSAVGNLVMLTLICLTKFRSVRDKILQEIYAVTENHRDVNLMDKSNMPYTEAAIFETLRFTSSPIVPHVATEDTDIEGKFVKKGTCVILNNYELNKSSEYWDSPEEFFPERFIKDGIVVKPAHFIPFGTGKRTCMGQQLVQGFSFVMIAGILQHFDILIPEGTPMNLKSACVALPPDTFPLKMVPR